jgi:hypothetical protein
MKKIVLSLLLVLAVLMAITPVFAQDKGGSRPVVVFRPSISFGYVGDAGEVGYSLSTLEIPSVGGIPVREFHYDHFSSLYLDATLSASIGERLGAEISTRWAIPSIINDLKQEESHVNPASYSGGRTWGAKTLWSVLDANVSYALVKDGGVLKSFAPKVGVRWDYWDIEGDNPDNSAHGGIAVYSDSDTMEFYNSTVMPYAGFSATFGGLQWGMFGGDLTFDAVAGFLAWGKAKHDELRNGSIGIRHDVFEGNLDRGYFYELSLDYNVLTLDFSPKVQGTVGLFGKLSGYHATGELEGTRSGFSTAGPYPYSYSMDRTLFLTGITLAVTFDIYGKPQPAAPAAPAPIIEPKLEPMSRN